MRYQLNTLSFLSVLIFLIAISQAFKIDTSFAKLPWGKHYFQADEKVELLVNTVESEHTQLPYAYYNLPFVCPPTHNARPVHLSLGEVLKGERFWQSDYQLTFEKDEACRRLCDRIVDPSAIKRADELIKNDYMVEWTIDDLPGSTTFVKPKTNNENYKKYYVAGFPLGFVDNGISYLHNHVMMVIRWHKENGDPSRKTIVGFEVYPKSVSDYHCPGAAKNFANFGLNPDSNENLLIPFTYSVYWREDFDVSYDNRLKMFLNPGPTPEDGKMHWFALVNSLVVVSLLSLVVGVVFLRTLSTDFKSSNNSYLSKELSNLVNSTDFEISSSTGDNNQKSTGWRLISNEVFVQPSLPVLLSAFGGSGIQLSFTMFGLSILCISGISGLNSTILSTAIGLFVVAGFFAGFAGVQFYKTFTFNQKFSWRGVSFLSGSLLTGLVLLILFILNFIIWAKDSSMALPFGTILALILIYVVLEIPISLVGGYVSNKFNLISKLVGSKKLKATESAPSSSPQRLSIPKQPFYNKFKFSLFIFGVFPFGIIFVEMVFLFKSLYVEKMSFYYKYGFLSLTALLLFVVILEISIISTYLRLNSGDYLNWQWKSFITSFGSLFLYLMIYTVYYMLFSMKIVDVVSIILYLFYSTLLNLLISAACGGVGLLSSTLFVYKIYSSLKVVD